MGLESLLRLSGCADTKIPEVAATLPKQVVIFTGLNDCNHYTEIADYRRDYVTMLQQLKASIPGVKIMMQLPMMDHSTRCFCTMTATTWRRT